MPGGKGLAAKEAPLRARAVAVLIVLWVVVAACADSGGVSSTPSPETPGPPPEPAATPAASATANTAAAPPSPTATPVDPARLPIIDMHFHADAAWDFEALVGLMDNLGVEAAGSGATDLDSVALDYVERRPERFFAFANLAGVRALNLAEGAASWRLESPRAVRELERLERGLMARCWSGIGEVFVNTLASHRARQVRIPADSPLMQRLWSLSATYGVPLAVHMDAEPTSVAEMERLLASDRAGTWLWAHSGWYASPSLLRRLLQDHLNLFADLSFRDSIRSFASVDVGGQLRAEWRELFEDMPDRFVLGTDVLTPTAAEYSSLLRIWRSVLGQLSPDVALKLSHQNAERLVPRSAVTDAAGLQKCREL